MSKKLKVKVVCNHKPTECHLPYGITHLLPNIGEGAQGCGLGQDVSVSRCTNVSSRTKSSTSRSRSNVSQSRPSRSRLGSWATASCRDVLCRRTPCIL